MDIAATILPDMPRQAKPEDEKRVTVGAKVAPVIRDKIVEIARSEDRTFSYIVERLLRQALGIPSRRVDPKRKR